MSDAKFTPGEWHTSARNNDYQSQVYGEGGKTIAVMYTTNDADAHLIAAAKDLYAACQLVIEALDIAESDGALGRVLRAAVTKAQGQ